ncbi:MAG: SIMPL domain-containing protein, partial [Candidatus Levyibacteriota bacterium]
IIVAGIIISALIISNSFNGISPGQDNVISAQGVSTVKAMPNLVSVYFNIETKAKTSENATKLNSDIVEKLKSNLIAQGFDEKKIQTQGFSVYPNYEWVGGKQVDKGFIATHSLILEMSADESEKIGKAIDAGVSAGAGISYINFELTQEKQNEYKAEALELAAQDAKIKAQATASGLDQEIGKLVSVQVDNFGYYPWNVYSGSGRAEDAMLAKAETTSITPSEQEVTASVTAVFKLK